MPIRIKSLISAWMGTDWLHFPTTQNNETEISCTLAAGKMYDVIPVHPFKADFPFIIVILLCRQSQHSNSSSTVESKEPPVPLDKPGRRIFYYLACNTYKTPAKAMSWSH